jgi:hypothetical protein
VKAVCAEVKVIENEAVDTGRPGGVETGGISGRSPSTENAPSSENSANWCDVGEESAKDRRRTVITFIVFKFLIHLPEI